MNRYREVFEERSVTKIVIKPGDLSRFTSKNNSGTFHIYSCRGDEIVEVIGKDCLCGHSTVKNKDIPEIFQTFRNSYPDERIYMLIWIIGPEDMSEVGFLSSADEIAFNPLGDLGNEFPVSDHDVEKTLRGTLELPISNSTEVKPNYCPFCLKVIEGKDESYHCERCELLTHRHCMCEEGDKKYCNSCANTLPDEKIMKTGLITGEDEGFTKTFAKLRTTCMEIVMDSPILTDNEREVLAVTIRRARELSDLSPIVSRFSLTSQYTVPELSRKNFDDQQLKDILKVEINNYGTKVLRALKSGQVLPELPLGTIDFVLRNKNISQDTVVDFFKAILSPEWIGQIVDASVDAAAKTFSKRYKVIREVGGALSDKSDTDCARKKITRINREPQPTEQEKVDSARSV